MTQCSALMLYKLLRWYQKNRNFLKSTESTSTQKVSLQKRNRLILGKEPPVIGTFKFQQGPKTLLVRLRCLVGVSGAVFSTTRPTVLALERRCQSP